MKQTLLTIICLLTLSPALRAQDKIRTTDGQTIECRIIDLNREDRNVVYQTKTKGSKTQLFIRPDAVEYIERDGKKWARNTFNEFEPLEIQYIQRPELRNMYGVYGIYTSSVWGVAASYTHYFHHKHGLAIELAYLKSSSIPDLGIGLMPSYEYRTFIHKMRSFFFAQVGIGTTYYRTKLWAGVPPQGPFTFKTMTISAGIKLGFDVRLTKGLYLNIAGRLQWDPKAFDVGKSFLGLTATPEDSYGVSLGLRFGREK